MKRSDGGREALSLMATTFTLAGGLLVAILIQAISLQDPEIPMLLTTAAFGIYGMVLLRARLREDDAVEKMTMHAASRRPPEIVVKEHTYRFAKIRTRENRKKPEPPTAEKIRELKGDSRPWSPGRLGPDEK